MCLLITTHLVYHSRLLILVFLNFIYPGESVFRSVCLLKLEKGGSFQLFDKLKERLHDFAGFLSKLVMVCSQTEESNFLPPASLPPQPKFAL